MVRFRIFLTEVSGMKMYRQGTVLLFLTPGTDEKTLVFGFFNYFFKLFLILCKSFHNRSFCKCEAIEIICLQGTMLIVFENHLRLFSTPR